VILAICYAAGLRISKAGNPKAEAIDSQRVVIRVENGKVMLSPKLPYILASFEF